MGAFSSPGSETLRVWLADLQHAAELRSQHHLQRVLRPVQSAQGTTVEIQGRSYVQFCTNNYLGLANDPEVIDAARAAISRYGTGAGASRLVAGSMDLHHQLERALANFKQTEAALIFPTGFMANLAVLTTLAGPLDRIVSDKLNHASLLDAARWSGADHRTFPHRNLTRAKTLLARPAAPAVGRSQPSAAPYHLVPPARGTRSFLVSDSVFSMDGDVADLAALSVVAESAGALLVVDEAHATGVFGEHGRGIGELAGVENHIAASVGTLSKALGSIGGFVCGSQALIDTLVNEARSFIYTTALPPACSAAALTALTIIARRPQLRRRVLALAAYVREHLKTLDYDCGHSCSPIIPVICGSAESALEASEVLKQNGIFVPAIRPPTVAPGTARLRLSLMATHSDDQVELMLKQMGRLRDRILVRT